jgi:hypothetical protein
LQQIVSRCDVTRQRDRVPPQTWQGLGQGGSEWGCHVCSSVRLSDERDVQAAGFIPWLRGTGHFNRWQTRL